MVKTDVEQLFFPPLPAKWITILMKLVIFLSKKVNLFDMRKDYDDVVMLIPENNSENRLKRTSCALGVSASLFFDENTGTCEILTYKWNLPSPVVSKLFPLLDQPLRLPGMLGGFDEDTDRVLSSSGLKSFLVEIH